MPIFSLLSVRLTNREDEQLGSAHPLEENGGHVVGGHVVLDKHVQWIPLYLSTSV